MYSMFAMSEPTSNLSSLLKDSSHSTERVVPVVIFLRGGRYARELVLGGDERTYLRFSFLSCVLPDLSYEDYRDSSNIVARLQPAQYALSSRAAHRGICPCSTRLARAGA
ncbi:MAG TPA: hypothetical protein VKN82_04040 [Desulfohalobiaceae bacterium]|nr:hypothetical protein [Desulfohalobiaceae bacterium]